MGTMRNVTPHRLTRWVPANNRGAPQQPWRLAAWAMALVVGLFLTACAISRVQPGMSRQQVIARMGQPTNDVALPSGSRLQYSRQPAGQQVYNVELDASGRVLQVRQMLTPSAFDSIELARWTRDDVLQTFGPPASVDHVANWSGDILTYRWRDGEDMFFWIYLDSANRVQRTGQGVEYHHDD